jgi:hypothetical protein
MIKSRSLLGIQTFVVEGAEGGLKMKWRKKLFRDQDFVFQVLDNLHQEGHVTTIEVLVLAGATHTPFVC